MSSGQLMCVWQSVYAKELFKGSGDIPKEALQQITCTFSDIPYLENLDLWFNDTFTASNINYQDYKHYIDNVVRKRGVPLQILYDEIEKACWQLCKPFYNSTLNKTEVEKLWTIFNRLIYQTSYPPMISPGDANWFVNELFDKLQKKWRMTLFSEDASFVDCLALLEKFVFRDSKADEIKSCINDMYMWLVNEERRRGIVKTRAKVHANWTHWTTKSCILTSRKIIFHEPQFSPTNKEKDSFHIRRKTKVETLPEITGISGRLRLSNGPADQCEIAVGTEGEAALWVSAIKEAIECFQKDTTPVQNLIKELHKQHDVLRGIQASLTKWRAELVDIVLRNDDGTASTDMQGETSGKPTPKQATTKNVIGANKEKIKGVFMKIDKNGNGKIEINEFAAFIESMGLNMTEKELNLVFNSVDKDNNSTLSYDEFERYLLQNVMDETSDADSVNSLRMAFMEADRNGSGTINFQEFSEYIWEKKRSAKMTKLLQAFSKMQQKGSEDVDFDQFRQMLSDAGAEVENYEDDTVIDDFEDELKKAYSDTEVDEVTKMINERWKSFNNFDRKGYSGSSVMTTDGTMVADFVPGEYSLVDLACFTDLPPLEPKHVVIKNVRWISSGIPGKSGKLVLPADFDGKVFTEIATNELLRYYGCSFADSKSEKVSLLHRHGIQDFTYENGYLEDYVKKKGAGIETHQFSHLDCPLSNESGTFVLGKLTKENNLHLTGFKIPTRHVLYVPKGCIHSNDYLTGTWRTMLSDAAPIDHVNLKVETQGGMSPMTLTFF